MPKINDDNQGTEHGNCDDGCCRCQEESSPGGLDILCVGAHPDDCELMMGGTMLKMINKGYTVGILDLTKGEMGTRGSAEIRENEARHAQDMMGAALRENLGIPDTGVELNLENRNRIIEAIRRLKPGLIAAPWNQQRHPDHNHASELVTEACFFSGLRKYPQDGDPYRPRKIIYYLPYSWDVKPDFFVDISDFFEKKIELIQCYHSQFVDIESTVHLSPYVEGLLERIRHFNGFFGRAARVQYAEGFIAREPVLIDDIMELKVPSY